MVYLLIGVRYIKICKGKVLQWLPGYPFGSATFQSKSVTSFIQDSADEHILLKTHTKAGSTKILDLNLKT